MKSTCLLIGFAGKKVGLLAKEPRFLFNLLRREYQDYCRERVRKRLGKAICLIGYIHRLNREQKIETKPTLQELWNICVQASQAFKDNYLEKAAELADECQRRAFTVVEQVCHLPLILKNV